MPPILMGPILSFRGCASDRNKQWRVSAMVVMPKNEPVPEIYFDNRGGSMPVELLSTDVIRVLRYDLSVERGITERKVSYFFNRQRKWEFTVPAQDAAPRMAYVSCNGFSDPKSMQKLKVPFNAVWNDLLCNHDASLRPRGYIIDKEQRWHEELIHKQGRQRFHLLAMGGDQIYFDSILYAEQTLPELCAWREWSLQGQIEYQPSDELKGRISDYYLNLYIERWCASAENKDGTSELKHRGAATAMASIPTIMMWDDHDIIDGWGSYPPKFQYCAVLRHMFHTARRAFWIFQLQQRDGDLPELEHDAWDGITPVDAPAYGKIGWASILSNDPLALPLLDNQSGFSYCLDMGRVSLLVPDLRTERSKTQILGEFTWEALTKQLNSTSPAEHVLVMSSVPVAYPKLGLAELGLGLTTSNVKSGLADDLNDHWSHRLHEGERKRFIRAIMAAAIRRKVRITILSGDVHVAAWGSIYRKDATPAENWLRINQLTSSSVVHPSPTGLLESLYLTYVNNAAKVPQPIDTEHVVNMMLFPESDVYVQATRNWLALELDEHAFEDTGRHRMWATWRCERESDTSSEVNFSNHLLAIHPVRQTVPITGGSQ